MDVWSREFILFIYLFYLLAIKRLQHIETIYKYTNRIKALYARRRYTNTRTSYVSNSYLKRKGTTIKRY